MKIIYYSSAKIPSSEANSIHIVKMCQAYVENNCDVELIAPDYKGLILEEPYSFYGVKRFFNIKKLPWRNIKGKAYIYAFEAALYVKKQKVDFAYGRDINIAYFLSFLTDVGFALELHQPITQKRQIRFFKKIICSKNCKGLVVISENLKKYFMETYSIPENRIFVAHDGADICEKVDSDVELINNENTCFNVGYIGHLYKGKGMEIVSQIIPKMPMCSFHIVGGRDEDVEKWKKELESYNNVHFYGFVPHSKTIDYGMKFDVVLAPYLKEVYGVGASSDENNNLSNWMSPLKIFEYMSMGKTIICTNLSVLKEILKNMETGILCDADNIDEWVNAIEKCMKDLDMCKKIGENAKVLFEAKYTWQIRAKNILENFF